MIHKWDDDWFYGISKQSYFYIIDTHNIIHWLKY